jgi:ArsR family transcriptional regulator
MLISTNHIGGDMNFDSTLNVFRAIGEETRLRIMLLLQQGELTVSEIVQILGQSQPRVSRHLKILADAGLIERHREGSWMFYRVADSDGRQDVAATLHATGNLAAGADRVIARDRDRFAQIREVRSRAAAAYFQENAGEWDQVRQLHLPERDIEARMRALVGEEPVGFFIDLGTGTGRMLEIFASSYERGVGFDLSLEMLAIARANLERAGVSHAQVRQGDLFSLPIESGAADLVCLHQVLHFLAEPGAAVCEAARLLKPGGRLLISDFAPHEVEFLRDAHAHRRLGFPDAEVEGWCRSSSLQLVESESLSPRSQDATKLTVKIWLCSAAATVRTLKSRSAA